LIRGNLLLGNVIQADCSAGYFGFGPYLLLSGSPAANIIQKKNPGMS
jgi:hypothetical protein